MEWKEFILSLLFGLGVWSILILISGAFYISEFSELETININVGYTTETLDFMESVQDKTYNYSLINKTNLLQQLEDLRVNNDCRNALYYVTYTDTPEIWCYSDDCKEDYCKEERITLIK